jgi:GNAT superfamily N-acetyltransferase
MRIRLATPDDAEQIAAVDGASWQAAYRGLMADAYLDALSVEERAADWRRRLLGRDAERGRFTLVADHGGAVLGFVRLGPDPDDAAAGFVFLLYVLPRRWRGGVGTALMAAAEAALRDGGFASAALGVLEANERARRFYERRGWRSDGSRRSDDYGGRELTALRYTRSL